MTESVINIDEVNQWTKRLSECRNKQNSMEIKEGLKKVFVDRYSRKS